MQKEWLDLEEFIKMQIAEEMSNKNLFFLPTLFFIKAHMEKLKSEAYYQSLKEAGYF